MEPKPIPESVTVNTGEQHLVQPTIDDFFCDTVEHIRTFYNLEPGLNYFLIKSGMIEYSGIQSDERVTYLSFYGRAVASVLETRTEFNFVRYTFFRNLEGIEELARRYNETMARALNPDVK
ncbi:MAG: hypothetical protein AABX64_00540 [Nanoarchaeota archaeon]